MKWILVSLLLFCVAGYGQSDDAAKYIRYQNQYGMRMPRFWSDSILRAAGLIKFTGISTGTDTTTYKPIAIDPSGNVFRFNRWPGSGGSGIPAGTDQDIQYNNSSAFGGSSGRFVWNNTAKRMSIFGTSTNDLNNLDDHSFKTIGNRWYLGDTTSDEPTFLEFGDPYGASNSTPMRMSLGWMGTEEFNIGVNFHYRGQVHLKYDNTKYAQWLAYNPHYFLMQAQGIGYDWNDNAGSKVVWRFDNIESSGKAIGSILSTNGVNVIDPTTSSYQNNDGYMAQLRVSSATLGIGGVPAIRIPDSTQTFMGDLSDMGILLGLQKAGANTEFMMRNDDNNSNTNVIRLYKRRGASYGISLNDKIGFISWSTLNEFGSIANANTILAGAFRLADFFWNTTDVSGNTSEKMRLKDNGQLKLNTYGAGSYTGTPAYTLQVDASGNIIEGSSSGSNISNSSLTANGDYTQDWNGKQLIFNNIKNYSIKSPGVLKNSTILGDTSQFRITQNIRSAADNADSITRGIFAGSTGTGLFHLRNTTVYSHLDLHESSNTARAELEVTNNLAGSLLNDGAGIQMKQGNITIVAKDSLEIPSGIVTVADSVYVPGSFDPSSGTNILKKISKSDFRGYKQYTVLLSQSGTSDPTATILEPNDIGTIVWTRNSTGNYTGTLSSAFTSNKTWLICQKGDGNGSFVNGLLSRASANAVTLDVRDNGDVVTDNFTNLSIEIRVYP